VKVVLGHVSVALRRLQAAMPEQNLNRAHVHAVLQQVGRETVALMPRAA
jgi:hypothetical protein